MKIEPGKFYTHAEGGRYRVLALGMKMKCPQTGEWHKAVSYEPGEYGPDKDFGNGKVFIRTQKNFVARFSPAEGPTAPRIHCRHCNDVGCERCT